MATNCKKSNELDCICGVPYAALPFASVVCVNHKIPMLIRRKEAKEYGTAKLIEGVIVDNQTCLIVEDVVTTGSSVFETAKLLRANKLNVKDAVVIFDRQQGAGDMLLNEGIQLHSVLTLEQTLKHLMETGKISQQIFDDVHEFLRNNTNVGDSRPSEPAKQIVTRSLEDRAKSSQHIQVQRLYEIMMQKKTNLCVAVDLKDAQHILKLVSAIGSEICLLKLHADIINDFSSSFVAELKNMSVSHNFLIMEDRKFSDIGNTVAAQMNCDLLKIPTWANFITVHSISGPGLFDGLHQICLNHNIACLIVAEMSSKDALCNNNAYKEGSIRLAKEYCDIVAGFICQKRFHVADDCFIYVTPGVNLQRSGDSMKQNWRSPQQAIDVDKNDIFIVGRGITEAEDPYAAAIEYKTIGWASLGK